MCPCSAGGDGTYQDTGRDPRFIHHALPASTATTNYVPDLLAYIPPDSTPTAL